MTHNEVYLSLIQQILRDPQSARIYPSQQIDGTFADILVATQNALIGYVIISRDDQLEGFSNRAKLLSDTCSVNYLATPFSMSEDAFAILPDSWGYINVEQTMIANNYWCPVEHPADPAKQLDLLWEGELHDILNRFDVSLLSGRSDAFLKTHILKRLSAEQIHEAVCYQLLYRNYDKIGQPDLTLWTPALEIDPQWSNLYEENDQRPHATPISKSHTMEPKKLAVFAATQPMSLLSYGPASTGTKSHQPPENKEEKSLVDRSHDFDQDEERLFADPVHDFDQEDDSALFWDDVDPFEVPFPERENRNVWVSEPEFMEDPALTQKKSKKTTRHQKKRAPLKIPPELKNAVETVAEPRWVPWNEIEVWPGVPWIPVHIIEDFVSWIRYGNQSRRQRSYYWYMGKDDVEYNAATGSWYIDNKGQFVSSESYRRLESRYGISGYNALRIFEAMLNLRQIRLETESRTAAALERQDLLLKEFQKWLFKDAKRREEVEKLYNEAFSSFRKRVYDGTPLTFPQLNPDVELYPYQKNAVAQILSERNTLLAFDVGAGKTYIMAAAAMKLRQMDPNTKNLFVVPNNIVGQWESIFHMMYKDARLLVVDPKTFKPSERQRILKDIRDNDYDGIIMAYSCFEMIKLSNDEIDRLTKDELRRLPKKNSVSFSLRTPVNRAEEAIKKKAARVKKSVGSDIPGDITLDQLGITMLYVDEAHNYKNVPIRSSLKTVAGLNLTGSSKCLAMSYKVRAVQASMEGRGVVFATGTPLSNSLVDCYTMQMYLQRPEMEKMHLDVFDNWIKSFARPESVCEIDVDTSRFRYVNRLAFFHNLPELSRMFALNSTFYAMDETDDIPELFGYTNVLLDRSKPLEAYMQDIVRRTERIRAKKVPPAVDNMLKISTDGRKAALDLRLVGCEQPRKFSKISACVSKVLEIYHQDPSFTQIVFCDYSTPKREGFTVYADLKKQLVSAGIPPNEIEFVHTASNTARKKDLFEKVNRGDIRILIGSTFKLGIGANVQTHLKAVHHLDIPWRPADMVQREGRILRKGNSNDRVKIFRYIAEGSFDAYCWQLLENKQKFISQFLSGAAYDRTIQDLEDNVLTYAQVKALAISEPLMKDLAEKQNALRRLRLVANNFEQDQRDRDEGLDDFYKKKRKLESYAVHTEENAAYLKETYKEEDFRELYKDIKTQFSEEYILQEKKEPMELCGFALRFPPVDEQNQQRPYMFLSRLGEEYRLKLSKSATGNARRLTNFFKNFDDTAKAARDSVNKITDQIHGRENIAGTDNPYKQQIAELEEEIRSLRTQILERSAEVK